MEIQAAKVGPSEMLPVWGVASCDVTRGPATVSISMQKVKTISKIWLKLREKLTLKGISGQKLKLNMSYQK